MDGSSHTRWERVLLVLAALIGVVAMHSTVGPGHDASMSASAGLSVMASTSHPGAHSADAVDPTPSNMPAMTAASGLGDAPTAPMSMPHALMHLCLAVIAAGIVLGLLVAVLLAVLPGERSLLGRAPRSSVRPARPPRPTGVRLAQLCVLRN